MVYFPHAGVPKLAWKGVVKISRPAAEWKMYLEAATGETLEKLNLLKSVDGQGRVFDPNPVVTLNNPKLKDKSSIPANAYFAVTLKGLKAGGKLDGPYVSTKRTANRVKRTDRKFLFSRRVRPRDSGRSSTGLWRQPRGRFDGRRVWRFSRRQFFLGYQTDEDESDNRQFGRGGLQRR
ncbi:hypothetical protein L0337_40370 [candidate division KSB1 bacterium]|nr:hypothetical protein [candidate division KSB1 bacterium]